MKCYNCGRELDEETQQDRVCYKCQLQRSKQREVVLMRAIQKLDYEREEIYEQLWNNNRCLDCAKYKSCLEKVNRCTMRAKQENDTMCILWTYKGRYTPVEKIMSQARTSVLEESNITKEKEQ